MFNIIRTLINFQLLYPQGNLLTILRKEFFIKFISRGESKELLSATLFNSI